MPQDLRSAQASKWESLPTEAINPNSLGLDTAPIGEIIDLMIAEDRKVVAAVHRERDRIAHGVEIIEQALRRGGRIFFIGAGTSGRLGVVEAAEMPPTRLESNWMTPSALFSSSVRKPWTENKCSPPAIAIEINALRCA